MSFQVGEDIGDYKIVASIGGGVFQVEHHLTKRKEAAKVLSTELATDVQIQRFEREIALQAQLDHPNIATLHNAFRWKSNLILVMEFVEGATLEQLLRHGAVSIDAGVNYIRQTLSALAYAHARGVVHRDVTPANLIVTPGGAVKLTDFGVSKSVGDIQLTNCGDILGNLDYMAPEQARGSTQPDRRSDLYSVGAILYQILTGAKPFGEGRKFGPLVMDSEGDPRPPSELAPLLAPQWNEVVGKALIRNRDRRYSSATEFLAAIEQATQVSSATLTADTMRRWRFRIAGAGIAAVVAVLPVTVGKIGSSKTTPAPVVQFHIPAPELYLPRPTIAEIPPVEKPRGRSITAISRYTDDRASAEPEPPATKVQWTEHAPSRADRALAKPFAAVQAPVKPDESVASTPESAAPAEPQPAATTEPDASTTAPSEHKETKKPGFWGRLNPFKKKSQSSQ